LTPEQLHNLISQGESETLEFKASFTKAVIETLVAILYKEQNVGNTQFLQLENYF